MEGTVLMRDCSHTGGMIEQYLKIMELDSSLWEKEVTNKKREKTRMNLVVLDTENIREKKVEGRGK